MGLYTIHVVGESYDNPDGSSRQAEIRRCQVGQAVRLQRDRGNAYDENAVAVLSRRGVQIGFVGRDKAQWISRVIDEGGRVEGRIQKIIGGGRGKPNRGVILDVVTAKTEFSGASEPATAAGMGVEREPNRGLIGAIRRFFS